MKAVDCPFAKIINGTSQFLIPVFQRDYSWTVTGRGAWDLDDQVPSAVGMDDARRGCELPETQPNETLRAGPDRLDSLLEGGRTLALLPCGGGQVDAAAATERSCAGFEGVRWLSSVIGTAPQPMEAWRCSVERH